ncbi:isoprenyl transferase [Nakamurella multipartita]|uniref:Isoprenyl transferase n=1 Tax=Nakamurella multipartita (strain ATCC 700099 / DSM 44233 / CIP 104796 / JCM 9543 / NBRC 105858 / Y-104) TaxID=479431 RepID=C8XKP3_NAKMY|nr:isoprenyl transferase [Nakamurella multipartita]ACV80700.1 undecaprenyl diphosphate synthase [Nakamurella multipartita DSM 44233]
MRLPSLVYRVYERKLTRELIGAPIPHHVGVMLDGNRRWARKAGFTNPTEGHRAGAAHIVDLLEWCQESGIGMVTLWLLSTDNLRRPGQELQPLLEIITDVVEDLAAPDRVWKLRIVGALDLLPEPMSARLTAAATRTEHRRALQVNIAVGYGGRQEIVDAVKSMLEAGIKQGHGIQEVIDSLNVETIGEHLYTSGQPDPDLVIRTSGEQRLSGFLLWQSAHSEFWFCEAYWPDFRRVDFLRALRDYAARHRRYGE